MERSHFSKIDKSCKEMELEEEEERYVSKIVPSTIPLPNVWNSNSTQKFSEQVKKKSFQNLLIFFF